MAHYAFLDDNNIVTEVIVGIDETQLIENIIPEQWYGNFRNQKCVRTSYNGNIRKQFAGVGFSYDEERDIFIQPKPYNSWILNELTYKWEPPIQYPDDGLSYEWDEINVSWNLITF
jgi:hypothetical protein